MGIPSRNIFLRPGGRGRIRNRWSSIGFWSVLLVSSWLVGCGSSKRMGQTCTKDLECGTGLCVGLTCAGIVTIPIGSEGGSVATSGGELAVVIPTGALGSQTTLTLARSGAAPSGQLGIAYQLGPEETPLKKKLTVTLRHDIIDLKGNSPDALGVGRVDNGVWTPLADSKVNGATGTVSGTSATLGTFAVVTLFSGALRFQLPGELPPATVDLAYKYAFCAPEPAQSASCGALGTDTTNPIGGKPPYTFVYGSGIGAPPFKISMGINGLLTGTPDVQQDLRTFEVCAKDTEGAIACVTTSLRVNPPEDATPGDTTTPGDATIVPDTTVPDIGDPGNSDGKTPPDSDLPPTASYCCCKPWSANVGSHGAGWACEKDLPLSLQEVEQRESGGDNCFVMNSGPICCDPNIAHYCD